MAEVPCKKGMLPAGDAQRQPMRGATQHGAGDCTGVGAANPGHGSAGDLRHTSTGANTATSLELRWS